MIIYIVILLFCFIIFLVTILEYFLYFKIIQILVYKSF